jgi:hypothetical protein
MASDFGKEVSTGRHEPECIAKSTALFNCSHAAEMILQKDDGNRHQRGASFNDILQPAGGAPTGFDKGMNDQA